MRFTMLLTTFLAGVATATNIAIYPQKGCQGSHGICRDVKKLQCCYFKQGALQSALFSQMSPRAVGGTFRSSKKFDCNANTASREGDGCVTGPGKGAGFTCCVNDGTGSDALIADWECAGAVEPDVAVLSGRYFDAGKDVPAEIADRLMTLMKVDSKSKDIPADLEKYEIFEL